MHVALQAKVMSKLYLKLFPKLVSSLAVLLLCQFGYVACQSTGFSNSNRLPADEAKALGELMTTLGWGFQQFSSSSCDNNFQGIKCNCGSTVCHVTGLYFSNRELDGQINATALTSLHYLEEIDLNNNRLHGSIPDVTMGNLPSLKYLDLSTNFLNGSIPSSLGNLPSLQYMGLSYNMLLGQIPEELGNLSNLEIMILDFNELTGQLPPELGRLRSLYALELSSNNLSGELPGNYANFTSDQLWRFSVAGNRLTGQIPRFIANWTQLYYLSLFGNDFEGELPLELLFNMANLEYLFVSDVRSFGFPFPTNASMKIITYLMIRNCSISGEMPPYIGDWSRLKYLDLSFNNLSGGIPDSMKNLNLTKMFLTGNMLTGTVPHWLPKKIKDKADLSYNNFDDGTKKGEEKLNIQPNRTSIPKLINKCRRKPKYDSLYINCGGGETEVDGKVFEADSTTLNYHLARRENWAYSCSGDFGLKTYDSSDYIKNMECGDCDSAETQLYNSSRLCPLSLTYYGFCLFKGNYTVKLYFAETVYQSDEHYSNLGKRVFDVYIQILWRHVARCTKLSVHRDTPDHTAAHPDRPINLQIKPITAAGSVHPRSNGSQTSVAPVHHVRVHTVANLRVSLSSRRRLSLSPPISHLRPSQASKPPQKGLQPPKKQKPGCLQHCYLPIWPEKGRDLNRPPKFQPDDSPSSDINRRRYHNHRNPRPQIYQNPPFLAGTLPRKFRRLQQ